MYLSQLYLSELYLSECFNYLIQKMLWMDSYLSLFSSLSVLLCTLYFTFTFFAVLYIPLSLSSLYFLFLHSKSNRSCWSLNFVVAYYANFVIYQDSSESPDLPNSGQLERVECFPDLLGIYQFRFYFGTSHAL